MRPWSVEIWRLAGLSLLALVVGLALGQPGWSLAAALLGYGVWQLRRLAAIGTWLREGREGQGPPRLDGLGGEVVYGVQRLHQRHRRRRRKMAALLRRFRESTAAMPDATVLLGAEGQIEWFNDAATRLLGLKAPQDAGRRITQLVRHPTFTDYLAGGRYSEAVEMPSPVDDDLWLSVRIVPYARHRYLLAVRDVTRLHRLEQIRRDFVANVSHELRTPLTVISGYLEYLTEGEDEYPAHLRGSLDQMHAQAQRMRRLVEDLLMLSRLETDRPGPSEQGPVAVPELIEPVAEEARAMGGEQHQIQLELDNDLWLYGRGSELQSAFSNLLTNAVRYTPGGGSIRVRWYRDGSGAHFEVKDNGIGIEPHHVPRLTERFYRVEKDRSRATGGTGLGLAIVKHVLQRHDGHLRVESEPEIGSMFACDFPSQRVIARARDELARQG